MRPERIEPGRGQESVWDYPRPPRLEDTNKHIQIIFNGEVVADTRRAKRVLETSHPPVYYIPIEDIETDYLTAGTGGSWCEWKGRARYYTLTVGDRKASNVAWSYPNPTAAFKALKNHLAFYTDGCLLCGWRKSTAAAGRLLWRLDHGRRCGAVQGRSRHERLVNGRDE